MGDKKRMLKKEYQELLNTIDKDYFFEYYKNNCNENVLKEFNITIHTMTKLIHDLNLELTDEERKKRIAVSTQQCVFKKYGVDNNFNRRDVQDKIRQVTLEKYGVDNVFQSEEIKDKIKKTCLEKYGCEYYSQSEDFAEKYKKTCLEKYGVDSYSKTQECRDRTIKTCLERYGDISATSTKATQEKMKKTCLEKYGVEYATSSSIVKDKVKQTCLEKYKVPYYCLIASTKSNGNNSNVNNSFKRIFTNCGFDFEEEVIIGDYRYDFKIDKYLIEINPSATHNCSWGVHNNNKKDKFYHQRKSLNALEYGYRCIHIWDWWTETELLDFLYCLQHKIIPIDVVFTKPRRIIFDIKSGMIVEELEDNNKNIVEIFDDGVITPNF